MSDTSFQDAQRHELQMIVVYKLEAIVDSFSKDRPTLRDQFAMAALTGLLASPEPSWRSVPSQQEIIDKAYELADAMPAARADGAGAK